MSNGLMTHGLMTNSDSLTHDSNNAAPPQKRQPPTAHLPTPRWPRNSPVVRTTLANTPQSWAAPAALPHPPSQHNRPPKQQVLNNDLVLVASGLTQASCAAARPAISASGDLCSHPLRRLTLRWQPQTPDLNWQSGLCFRLQTATGAGSARKTDGPLRWASQVSPRWASQMGLTPARPAH